MAEWLERVEGIGGSLLDVIGDGATASLEKAVMPKQSAPDKPADRPEAQYPTEMKLPESGPEGRRVSLGKTLKETVEDHKWYAAGALALVAFLAIRGAR